MRANAPAAGSRRGILPWAVRGVMVVLVLATIFTLQQAVAQGGLDRGSAMALFAWSMVDWSTWLLLAPLVWLITIGFPIRRGAPLRNYQVHALCAILATPVWALAVAPALYALGIPLYDGAPADSLAAALSAAVVGRGPLNAIVYLLIAAVVTVHTLRMAQRGAVEQAETTKRIVASSSAHDLSASLDVDGLIASLRRLEMLVVRDSDAAEAEALAAAGQMQRLLLAKRPGGVAGL